ncbi:MAG: hypothetical protein ACT4PO_01530 [Actinomycetota bacterium]
MSTQSAGSPKVDAPLLEPMSRALRLHHLAAETVNLSTMGGPAIQGLRRLVERARCYALGGDDARDMLDALGHALRAEGRMIVDEGCRDSVWRLVSLADV